MDADDVVWVSERLVDGKLMQIPHSKECLAAWSQTPTAAEEGELGDVEKKGELSKCEHQIWIAPHRIIDWTKK